MPDMTLQLKLPPIAEQPDPEVELRPVYVEEWVEGLPYANPLALLRQYTDALRRFNRSPVKAALRLQLLELYLHPYLYLLELHEKQGPIQTITALERHRFDTNAARQVCVELAYGYKHVLTQSAGKRSLFGAGKEPKLALQRTTLLLSHALLHTFGEYLPTPPDPWRELHAIYRHAQRYKLHEQAVSGVGAHTEFTQPIDTLYKRILLTGVVDPYHLPYGDVWRVFALFSDFAHTARIDAETLPDKPVGQFAVDSNNDFRPIAYAQVAENLSAGCPVMDANPVRALLEGRFEELLKDGELTVRSGTVASLLGTMIRALGLPPKRHSPREYTEGRVSLVTGLSSLHHFLGGASTGEGARPDTEASETGDEEIEFGAGADAGANHETVALSYSAEFWELENKGPGGVGVVKHMQPNNAIGVGELIGVQFPMKGSSATDWTVGVVRWLSIVDAGEFQAGVQVLSQQAEAVQFLSPEGYDAAAAGTPRTAIAIPSVGAAKNATLITPAGLFGSAESLTLLAAGRSIEIRPESLIECTGAFDRFSYSLL